MKARNLFVLLILFSLSIYSQQSNFGIGLMVGEPTGLSGKYWVSESNAFAAGIGGHFVGPNDGLSIHLDYLYHIDNTFQTNFRFPLYYGFGARIRTESDKFGLGFRGVGGILFYPDSVPIDIFIEMVPVFKLLPKTNLEIDLSLGVRYFFN